jgi:hypothetical protein
VDSWNCSSGGTTYQVSATHRRQPRESRNASWQLSSSQRPCEASTRLAQVLPAPTPLPDQSRCIGPSRKTTFFLAKSGALPLRIRVPAAVHSQSFTSSNVDQCSAAFAPSAPFSVILDAREKSIAHAESVCALRYTRGPAVTPRLARLFARAPHSACPMSQFALCESGRLNAPVCQVTRRILCDLRTCT